ncbi:hypothetical protein GCM10011519_10790 [Marmoricola endophyticus]|uniref:Uncharacterized protein n=1 Tax=Marmoricola endophyticus TaxID=2040280 RepID=A0A917BE23_9ACTN|nr:hypothetical protein [Marmoricola endophyticus]GGF39005.1 hypothetical protein GCM10011519_10790 [Marmoricola endophyticus]
MVLGIVLAVVVDVRTHEAVARTDGELAADAQPHQVAAEHGERMLFREVGAPVPDCQVTRNEREVTVRSVDGSSDVTTRGRNWEGFARVEAPGGALTVTCYAIGRGAVRVGEPVEIAGSFGVALLGALGSLFVVTGAGTVVLVLTTVLWLTRKPSSSL